MTAMMRRKNTSRRVHAFSSDSIRSDEIAATDIARSRGWSRDGVSDMRSAVQNRIIGLHGPIHGPSARQNQSGRAVPRPDLRQLKMPMTQVGQDASIGTGSIQPAVLRSDPTMAIKFGRPIEMRDAPRRT